MTVWETVLIFVVPVVVVYLLLAWGIMGRRNAARPKYRTGDGWDHEPVLWTANPEGAHLTPAIAHETQAELTGTATTGGARGHW